MTIQLSMFLYCLLVLFFLLLFCFVLFFLFSQQGLSKWSGFLWGSCTNVSSFTAVRPDVNWPCAHCSCFRHFYQSDNSFFTILEKSVCIQIHAYMYTLEHMHTSANVYICRYVYDTCACMCVHI